MEHIISDLEQFATHVIVGGVIINVLSHWAEHAFDKTDIREVIRDHYESHSRHLGHDVRSVVRCQDGACRTVY